MAVGVRGRIEPEGGFEVVLIDVVVAVVAVVV